MPIELFFLVVLLLLTAIAFVPEVFPVCSCCGKKKFIMFFKINKAIKIHPGYSGSKSVCRKCCRLYGIETLQDLQKVLNIRRKIELNLIRRKIELNLDMTKDSMLSQSRTGKNHSRSSRKI